MMFMYKYTYWLIHNSAFTQHTHNICCKKLEITDSVCGMYREKTIRQEKNMKHKTSKFKKNTYMLYNTLLCFISHSDKLHHNYNKVPKNYLFVDVSIYPCIDTELCDHCFALPCECIPIIIVKKEGEGKLKHLKNLMKENEICTIKYIDKICHWSIIDVDAFHVYNLGWISSKDTKEEMENIKYNWQK